MMRTDYEIREDNGGLLDGGEGRGGRGRDGSAGSRDDGKNEGRSMTTLIQPGTTITPDLRDAWLATRNESLGASEVATAIGVNPWQAPIDLWQRKLSLAPATEENEAMRWGSILEPVILAEYERITGQAVTDRQLFDRHPEIPYLTATLDGVRADGRLVEVKTASAFSRAFGEEEDDELPDHYRVQVQAQFAVTGATEADLVVLIGGQRLRIYPIERNEDVIREMIRIASEFWECVQTRTPPTWGKLDARALAILNPGCSGVIVATPEMVSLAEVMTTAKGIEKTAKEEAEEAKVKLLTLMGSAETARLPDGRTIKRYLRTEAERTQTVKSHTKHYVQVLKEKK
jgi:putative phage-type endonuclease